MTSKPTKIILAVPLCFRGMAAWEEKIPINATVEKRHRVTLEKYRNKLKTETHVVPDAVSLKSGCRVNTRHEKVAIFILY